MSARDLKLETDLLSVFAEDVELAGVIGEKKNAKLVLLVSASAKLPRPLNLNIGGSSSAGKNHLIGTVARFIPESDQKFLTGMSPKALMHSEEKEFEHKVVYIAEYEGVSGADYAIRTMQSEQVIEWEFVDSSDKFRKKKTRVRGPAAFIQATTRVTLHPENETRLLFAEMDESEEQTRAINQQQALAATGKAKPRPVELCENWQGFFGSLEQKPVIIPFADQLSGHFPSLRIRSRRDFPKLLGLIEASAFLHQYQRSRDEQGKIIAAEQDYRNAKELFEHCYYAGPESRVGELLHAAETLVEPFNVTAMIEKTGWGKSKTYEVLKRAEELGCIGEHEKRAHYRLLRKHTQAPLSLPEEIERTETEFRVSAEDASPEAFRNSAECTLSQTFHDSTIPPDRQKSETGTPSLCGNAENPGPL